MNLLFSIPVGQEGDPLAVERPLGLGTAPFFGIG
jgi:hypothetical protein